MIQFLKTQQRIAVLVNRVKVIYHFHTLRAGFTQSVEVSNFEAPRGVQIHDGSQHALAPEMRGLESAIDIVVVVVCDFTSPTLLLETSRK